MVTRSRLPPAAVTAKLTSFLLEPNALEPDMGHNRGGDKARAKAKRRKREQERLAKKEAAKSAAAAKK